MDRDFERMMNRETVRYAVSRAIFCPDCGDVLDMDDAVLLTTAGGAAVACGACWDRAMGNLSSVAHAALMAQVASGASSVDDGRLLRG